LESGGPIRNNGQGAQQLIFREAEDRELAGRARKGDMDAFNALVSRWEARIYNYLLRLTGHAEDALDLCQDTFIKAYQNLARLEDPARFGPWLYRIAHNEAMSHLRRPQRESELDEATAAALRGPSLAPVEASLAVEAALLLAIVYTPLGNRIFGTAPLAADVWLFALPFVLLLGVAEETRKWLLRRTARHPSYR